MGDDEEEDEEDDVAEEGAEGRADERTALLSNGSKARPVRGTQKSDSSQRQLGMLYAATPPEQDSDRSSGRD